MPHMEYFKIANHLTGFLKFTIHRIISKYDVVAILISDERYRSCENKFYQISSSSIFTTSKMFSSSL